MVFKDFKSRTIAEYAIRKWLNEQNFAVEHFKLAFDGNQAVLADENGDTLLLIYDRHRRTVYVKEEGQ